jgi:hypothetical protein
LGDQRGAIVVITAIIMTVILLVAAYVIDEGIWFVHRQHLQTQADAAALAAAHDFQYPCSAGGSMDQAIANEVHAYDGTTTPGYNPQVWATPTSGPANPPLSAYSNSQHNLFSVLNRQSFYNQAVPGDTDLSGTSTSDGSPCTDAAIDVKLSETNLPSVFPFGGPAYINAQARVSMKTLTASAGAEPFVEPIPNPLPSSITASLIDESKGNTPVAGGGPITLSNSTANPGTYTGQLPSVTFPTVSGGATGASDAIGLKICYQGGSCYETGGGPQGVTYTRVWATGSPSANEAPQVNDITVLPDPNPVSGTPACPSPNAAGTNFISSVDCTIVVQATNVTFPSVASPTCNNVSLSLTVGSQSVSVPCPGPGQGNTWTSAPVTIKESSGQTNLTLNWSVTTGSIGGWTNPDGTTAAMQTCSNGNKNPCTGALGSQRVNSGALTTADAETSNSGSISGVALTDTSGNEIQSVQSNTTEAANVAVSVLSFQNASTFASPYMKLSFAGSQANAAISCGTGNGNGVKTFYQTIVTGCSDQYQTQPAAGASCPPPAAYSSPPSCAPENPGQGKLDSQLASAMNCRINGGGQVSSNGGNCATTPTTCVNPNHWTAGSNSSNPQTISQILSASPADPRLILLIITQNGALINGSANVPVIAFATFYITGWSGGDPCTNAANSGQSSNGLYYTPDDNPGANAPAGVLVGHFVQYSVPGGGVNGGQGTGTCTQGSFGDCIPVLTR